VPVGTLSPMAATVTEDLTTRAGEVADDDGARVPETADRRKARLGLAATMLGMGALHFVKPDPFEKVVPRRLGEPRRLVYASGVAELASGALLLTRRTSRWGGYLAAATMVSVFPANVQMVLDAGTEHQAMPKVPTPLYRAMGLARLPMQVPMVLRALRVARAG
jgi:uncharacterized membrane protein